MYTRPLFCIVAYGVKNWVQMRGVVLYFPLRSLVSCFCYTRSIRINKQDLPRATILQSREEKKTCVTVTSVALPTTGAQSSASSPFGVELAMLTKNIAGVIWDMQIKISPDIKLWKKTYDGGLTIYLFAGSKVNPVTKE